MFYPFQKKTNKKTITSHHTQRGKESLTITHLQKTTKMLNGSNLIKTRWKIIDKIGQGAFGEIYSGKNILTGELVAIKVEKVDSKKQVLKLEVAVLKKLQECPWVTRFITCGRFNSYNYMVMELLGDNLSELRKRQPEEKFSLLTTVKLTISMIRALESMHEFGYIHRDVKPSNFVLGKGKNKNTPFLIDFGLARRYVLPDGTVRPARESSGFRGTARYASINSHLSLDLGRRDDLWSVLYIMVEFSKGELPWRRLRDKEQIGEMKKQYNTPELVRDLPREYLSMMDHLQTLSYAAKPDYSYLISLLKSLYTKLGGDDNTLMDWEKTPSPSSSQVEAPASSFLPQLDSGTGDRVRLVTGKNEFDEMDKDEEAQDALARARIASFGSVGKRQGGGDERNNSLDEPEEVFCSPKVLRRRATSPPQDAESDVTDEEEESNPDGIKTPPMELEEDEEPTEDSKVAASKDPLTPSSNKRASIIMEPSQTKQCCASCILL